MLADDQITWISFSTVANNVKKQTNKPSRSLNFTLRLILLFWLLIYYYHCHYLVFSDTQMNWFGYYGNWNWIWSNLRIFPFDFGHPYLFQIHLRCATFGRGMNSGLLIYRICPCIRWKLQLKAFILPRIFSRRFQRCHLKLQRTQKKKKTSKKSVLNICHIFF